MAHQSDLPVAARDLNTNHSAARGCSNSYRKILALSSTLFVDQVLSYSIEDRLAYFEGLHSIATGSDLVFFDPDNGLEVPSVPVGRKRSCKYFYWPELTETYGSGASVLVYQHFPRTQRSAYLDARLAGIREVVCPYDVVALCTGHAAFFLLSQERHAAMFRHRIERMERQWKGQIWLHEPAQPILTEGMLAAGLDDAVKRISELEKRLKAVENQVWSP